MEGRLPDILVACVGGGSNSIGLFHPFLDDTTVKMFGVEAGGLGLQLGKNSTTLEVGRVGVLHGSKTYLLQTKDGQIASTHSISAGLDYPGVGPEHSYLKDIGRVKYVSVSDREAIEGFKLLSKVEGIVPALESSHAIAYLKKLKLSQDKIVIVCLSGRGDKDAEIIRGGVK
jgi:tryptophan synthase beta chain